MLTQTQADTHNSIRLKSLCLCLISSHMPCIRQVSHRPAVSCSRSGFSNLARGCSGPRHTVSLPHHTVSYYFPHSFHTFIHSLIYLFIAVTRVAQLGPVGRSPDALADISNERTLLLILSAPPPALYDSGINCSHRLPRDTGRCRGWVCQPSSLSSPAD